MLVDVVEDVRENEGDLEVQWVKEVERVQDAAQLIELAS